VPIYEFWCEKCECIIERIQTVGAKTLVCPKCDGVMQKKCGSIAIFKMPVDGITSRSKGYKEGYKKEYLKSTNREAWQGTIIEEPQAQG